MQRPAGQRAAMAGLSLTEQPLLVLFETKEHL